MPFDPNVVPRKLIEAVQQHNLVPFIGAGVSRQAGEDAFPSWWQLLDGLKARAYERGLLDTDEHEEVGQLLTRGQFLMAAEVLRSVFPTDEYHSILDEQFNPYNVRPAEVHRAIFKLKPPIVLTTNYDRLLEDAYANDYGRAPKVLTYRDVGVAQRHMQSGRPQDRPVVFKIHGTIDEPDSIVLSERDYRDLIYRQPGYRLFLSAIFLTQTVLMLGFSFSDREIMLMLEIVRESLKHPSDPDYIFLAKGSAGPLETRRWREDFGIQVIPYEASPGHPEVVELLNFLTERAASTT